MKPHRLQSIARYLVAPVGIAGLLVGCVSGPADCTTGEPRWAVHATFHDASTGALLTGATPGRIREGEFTDSLKSAGRNAEGEVIVMAAGKGRAGTYELTASRPGFEPVTMPGIVVVAGSCGVVSRDLRVDLDPDP